MKILLITSLALVGVTGAVASTTIGGARDDDCSLASFDTRAWTDESSSEREPGGDPSTRQRLADQLIECETLQGARRAQVRELLGRPDNYLSYASEEGTWSYSMGVERGGYASIDDEHLVVRFGREGRVRSAELATD